MPPLLASVAETLCNPTAVVLIVADMPEYVLLRVAVVDAAATETYTSK
jgi:hypothetical protein